MWITSWGSPIPADGYPTRPPACSASMTPEWPSGESYIICGSWLSRGSPAWGPLGAAFRPPLLGGDGMVLAALGDLLLRP